MERKRKLPARAAARIESASKKQNSSSTSPETSATPAPPPESTEPANDTPSPSTAAATAAAALPTSVQSGQPLPTVERPQPDDLPLKDFQSVQESCVLAESLSRSRQKWIDDGIFEKYWTKPSKRKGAAKEDANNPAKDTMVKIGQVTITVEPHVLEATMYGVKDPKPPPNPNPVARPVLQYGPPNGVMPPPKPTNTSTSTSTATATATATATTSPSTAVVVSTTSTVQVQGALPPNQAARPSPLPGHPSKDGEKLSAPQFPPTTVAPPSASPPFQQSEQHRPQLPGALEKPVNSPRGFESVLAAPLSAPGHPRPPQPQPPLSQRPPPPPHPLHAPSPSPSPLNTGTGPIGPVASAPKTTPNPPKPAPAGAPGADPIIVTLAEKASEDPQLRDLMKRVAVGEAAAHELAHFQKIIDQITLEYKRKGTQQGPSAERVMLNGKSVKWFADEVQNILDIVLAAEPNLQAGNLRPPPNADPVVVLLIREALDNPKVRGMIKRIAEGKTEFTDTMELKSHMDKVLMQARQDAEADETAKRLDPGEKYEDPSFLRFGNTTQNTSTSQNTSTPQNASSSQQALRSKGPPPAAKPDFSAVVLEFAGGTGDRYLFPKYSILQYSAEGTQVIASLLIVRKGSNLEYGGDPTLDYYQPVTIRLRSPSPKVLENLARVVAPKEDVQRYMDDIMDNMTRADYVLLAMRLPRPDREDQSDEREDTSKAAEASQPSHPPPVLWDTSSKPTPTRPVSVKPTSAARPASDDDQYQSFIASVSQPPPA